MYLTCDREAPVDEGLPQEVSSVENDDERLSPEDNLPTVGRNCPINIADKCEIVLLNKELEGLQRWFEEYGQDGILFPNSIINRFIQQDYCQAA